MIYEEHLRAAESAAWPLETSIRWSAIDRDAARAEPGILASLRDAAMIEGELDTALSRPRYARRAKQASGETQGAAGATGPSTYPSSCSRCSNDLHMGAMRGKGPCRLYTEPSRNPGHQDPLAPQIDSRQNIFGC